MPAGSPPLAPRPLGKRSPRWALCWGPLSFQKRRPWLLPALRLRVRSRCAQGRGAAFRWGVRPPGKPRSPSPLPGSAPTQSPKPFAASSNDHFMKLRAAMRSSTRCRRDELLSSARLCLTLPPGPPAGLFSLRVSPASFPSCKN